MSRRKGELTNARVDRGWPYQVALRAAATHGADYIEALEFCEGLSLCPRRQAFRRDDEYINVWCFAVEADALAFMARFGGAMLDPKDRPRWPG